MLTADDDNQAGDEDHDLDDGEDEEDKNNRHSCITKLGRLAGQWTCRCDGGNDDDDGDDVVDDEDGDDDDDDNNASVVKWMRQG